MLLEHIVFSGFHIIMYRNLRLRNINYWQKWSFDYFVRNDESVIFAASNTCVVFFVLL